MFLRLARDEGVLVLATEGDKPDEATQHRLENYGGLNVTVFSPEDGFIRLQLEGDKT